MARLRTTILLTVAMFAASNLTAQAFIAEAPSEPQQTPTESPHTGADDRLGQELNHLWKLITDPYREFIGKIIFTQTFMEAIAQCETSQDPAHIGGASEAYGPNATFRGAFGFWTTANGSGTFEYYGGRELTGTFWANETSYDQQKVIYLRKTIYGYTTPAGKYIAPRGLSRNNCLKYAGDPTYEIYWGR